MPLTYAKIRAVKPGPSDVWVGDGTNALWLRVATSGRKSWVIRGYVNGKLRKETIGRYPGMSLTEARTVAATKKDERDQGVATITSTSTVTHVAEEWFRDVISLTFARPHHVRGYLDRALIPELGAHQIRRISRRQLADSVKLYRTRGARGAHAYLDIINKLFKFAQASGYIEKNPAALLDSDLAGELNPPRARVLSDDEIRALFQVEHVNGGLLRFLLITGLRIGEAQKARWEWIEGDILRLPAEIMKGRKDRRRPHWIYLPPLAYGQMGERRELGRIFGLVSDTAVQAWLHRWLLRQGCPEGERWTPHDLRRTVATRMNEIGVAPHVVEKVLHHRMQGVMGVYNRAEYAQERTDAAKAWAVSLGRTINRQD
jgi:integrase